MCSVLLSMIVWQADVECKHKIISMGLWKKISFKSDNFFPFEVILSKKIFCQDFLNTLCVANWHILFYPSPDIKLYWSMIILLLGATKLDCDDAFIENIGKVFIKLLSAHNIMFHHLKCWNIHWQWYYMHTLFIHRKLNKKYNGNCVF